MKVRDKVKVISNSSGGNHPIGYIDKISEIDHGMARVGSGLGNWYYLDDLERIGEVEMTLNIPEVKKVTVEQVVQEHDRTYHAIRILKEDGSEFILIMGGKNIVLEVE